MTDGRRRPARLQLVVAATEQGTNPAARDSQHDRSGEVVDGKYLLRKRLGAGGMGVVYEALNRVSGRQVALKILRAEVWSSGTTRERFAREPILANRVLQNGRPHPNVIDVLDAGEDPVTHDAYIVSELLLGEDLESHLAGDGVPGRAHALAILLPVIDAVACAHENGVVHRDLKPANVFLAVPPGGRGFVPRVLDFGIAKMVGLPFTQPGEVLGTPEYMSPEGWTSARSVDARGDVWSLAMIAYRIVAGHTAFEGPGRALSELMWAVRSDAPESLAGRAWVTDAVWSVLARALSKEPGGRPNDARAFQRELVSALG